MDELPDLEHKICNICLEACNGEDLPNVLQDAEFDVQSKLGIIMDKLQLKHDNDLPDRFCEVCREELKITYHFILKIEEANQRFTSLNLNCSDKVNRDPLERSSSIGDVSLKSEDENAILEEKQNDAFQECESGDNMDDSMGNNDSIVASNVTDVQLKNAFVQANPNSQPRRCCDCKEPLSTLEEVEIHSGEFHRRSRITDSQITKDKPIECLVCFQRFITKKEYLQHQRKMFAEELYFCKRCPAEFANAYNLRLHEKKFHKKVKINEQIDELRQRLHKCCICRQQFECFDELKRHAEQQHPLQHEDLESENQFECDICRRRFKTGKVLIEHQRRPFRKNRFQCLHCGKTFKEKQAFNDHEQSHANIRPYECPICGKRFSLKPNYKTHVRYHSVPEDQFKCDLCGKGFRKKHLLQEHQVVHSESEARPHRCHICPNTFTRRDLLEFHIKEHLGEKPFKCSQCSASYIHERDLRRHTRTKHEDVRPFVCEVCSRAFSRKDTYGKHVRTHKTEKNC